MAFENLLRLFVFSLSFALFAVQCGLAYHQESLWNGVFKSYPQTSTNISELWSRIPSHTYKMEIHCLIPSSADEERRLNSYIESVTSGYVSKTLWYKPKSGTLEYIESRRKRRKSQYDTDERAIFGLFIAWNPEEIDWKQHLGIFEARRSQLRREHRYAATILATNKPNREVELSAELLVMDPSHRSQFIALYHGSWS